MGTGGKNGLENEVVYIINICGPASTKRMHVV